MTVPFTMKMFSMTEVYWLLSLLTLLDTSWSNQWTSNFNQTICAESDSGDYTEINHALDTLTKAVKKLRQDVKWISETENSWRRQLDQRNFVPGCVLGDYGKAHIPLGAEQAVLHITPCHHGVLEWEKFVGPLSAAVSLDFSHNLAKLYGREVTTDYSTGAMHSRGVKYGETYYNNPEVKNCIGSAFYWVSWTTNKIKFGRGREIGIQQLFAIQVDINPILGMRKFGTAVPGVKMTIVDWPCY